jgi:hypothetical protein
MTIIEPAAASLPSDDDIVRHYPLPIAHEYRQLLQMQTWWDKCQQLKDVLDLSLRYCVLIAVSDYLGRQWRPPDTDLDAWLPRKLISRTEDDLYEMLRRVMRVYHRTDPSLLMVRELYDFCCDSTGTRTWKMQEIRKLIDGFAKELDQGHLGPGDEGHLRELYEKFEPRLTGVLATLSFLKDYQLLRIYGADASPSGHEWQVRVLMGSEIDTMVQRWPMPNAPERHGVGLWDGTRQKLLMLYPFALFDKSEKYTQAFYSPAEELYLYEQVLDTCPVYVSLCKRPGGGSRMRVPTETTLNDLRVLLGVPNWPLVGEVPPPPEAVRVLDWRRLRGLAANQSQGQLELYRKEKYRAELYLQREMVEGDFRTFLEGDKNGFLVVGDSGTGKTNLLCHWVKEAQEREDDIVLFYNCAELPTGEELNLGELVASRLKLEEFGALLAKLEHERAERGGRFFLVLDGLNEHQAPLTLLNSLAQHVLKEVPAGLHDWFKVILSCRTEAWRRLERHFREVGLFYRTADGIGVRLPQFTAEELPAVYEKYREKHRLQTEFGELNEATKWFIADPLMLKFVAESYAEQELPPDPRTVDVFERYLKEKVGDPDDSGMDQQEKELVARLVELMYQAKRADLSKRDLVEDEVIGQAVLAAHDVRSPCFRLLDKGVLTEVKVGRAGPAAAQLFRGERLGSETRVRFTYDRFFEYLLAFYVMLGEVTVERVKELSTEATRERFPSLWGALKTRLIAYADTSAEAFSSKGVLAALAQEEDQTIRGLVVDTLAAYGAVHPQQTLEFLTRELLLLNSEAAGLAALFAGYRLGAGRVIEAAFHHPCHSIRDLATQYAYYLWSRQPAEGNLLFDRMGQLARKELLRAPLTLGAAKLRGKEIGDESLPMLRAFMTTTMLLSAYLFTNPTVLARQAGIWKDFYAGFGPLSGAVALLVKRIVGDRMVQEFERGPAFANLATLSVFTERPLGDSVREKVKAYASYLDPRFGSVDTVAEDIFALAQIPDEVVALVLEGILIGRSATEPASALNLLERLCWEGNEMARYNALRAMAMFLQQSGGPADSYLRLFNEAVLDACSGEMMTVKVPGRGEWAVNELDWAIVFEARQKPRGELEIIRRLMETPSDAEYGSHLVTAFEALGKAALQSISIPAAGPHPILETLLGHWHRYQQAHPEKATAVEDALVRGLARTWIGYPIVTESFLEGHPELAIKMRERVRDHTEEAENLNTIAGLVGFLFLPAALPRLIRVVEEICDNIVDAIVALHMIAEYLMDPWTLSVVAESLATGSTGEGFGQQ